MTRFPMATIQPILVILNISILKDNSKDSLYVIYDQIPNSYHPAYPSNLMS